MPYVAATFAPLRDLRRRATGPATGPVTAPDTPTTAAASTTAQSTPPSAAASPPRRPAPAQPSGNMLLSIRLGAGAGTAAGADPVADVIRMLERSRAAIAALQEVWRPADAEQVIDALEARYPHTAEVRTQDGERPGLIVMSARPIISAIYRPLRCGPSRVSGAGPAGYGLQAVDIGSEPSRSMRIINAHAVPAPQRRFLPLPRRRPPDDAWSRLVLAEIAALTVPRPMVLTGRFAPSGPAGAALLGILMQRGWRLADATETPSLIRPETPGGAESGM